MAMLAIFVLGWLVPLVLGIVRIASQKKYGGLLTWIGAVWGFLAVLGVAGIVIFFCMMNKRYEPQDFDPVSYKGKTGRIVIPHKGDGEITLSINEAQSLLGQSRNLRLTSTNGDFVAPAGKIQYISSIELTQTDEAGTRWKARTYVGVLDQDGNNAPTKLKEGQVLNLDIGQSLKAAMEVSPAAAGQVSMNMQITDNGKHSFTVSKDTPSLVRDKPKFQVLDSDGKVLWEDSLEYG
jgi:hypothetical protein